MINDDLPEGADTRNYKQKYFYEELIKSLAGHFKEDLSGFFSEASAKFNKGYNLEGLEEAKNYKDFFEEKGIAYVDGVIAKLSKEKPSAGKRGFLEKMVWNWGITKNARIYGAAKDFKKNYRS